MTSEELIEKIERILVDAEGVPQEVLAQLATEYASRCRRLNEKLERAAAQLRAGALSESERLVRENMILEELQTLSFRSNEDWRNVCRALGLEVASPASVETGELLKRFVASYAESSELFARHRRLALERGSARKRLAVAYQLEQRFPTCPAWARTIDALEKIRTVEIEQQFRALTSENFDREFVLSAIEELESSSRRAPIPNELLKSLHSALEQVDNSEALEKFRFLVASWTEALNQNDDAALLRILDRVRAMDPRVLAKCLAGLSSDEVEDYENAKQRALEIERQNAAIDELHRKEQTLANALARTNDGDELADLLAKVEIAKENAGVGTTSKLERQSAARISEIEQQQRRRRTFGIAAIVVICLLLGILLVLGAQRSNFEKKVNEATAALTDKLDKYESAPDQNYNLLDELERTIERNAKSNPKFNDDEAYDNAVLRFNQLKKADVERAKEFQEVVDEVRESHQKDEASPKIDQLKSLARTDEEKGAYRRLVKKNNELKRDSDKIVFQRYADKLEKLTDQLEELENSSTVDEAAISAMRRDIVQLDDMEQGHKIPEPSINAKKQIIAKLDGIERRSQFDEASSRGTEALEASLGNANGFVQQLVKFKDVYVNDSDALGRLDAAIKDAEAIAKLDAWNQFVDDYGDAANWAKNKSEYDKVAAAVGAIDAALVPEAQPLAARLDSVKELAQNGGFAAAERKLKSAFEPFSQELWVCYNSNAKAYYYPTVKPQSVAELVKRVASKDGALVDMNLDGIDVDAIAPAAQFAFYQKVDYLDGVPRDWFDCVLDILEKSFEAEERKLDPIASLQIVKAALSSALTTPFFDDWKEWEKNLPSEILDADFYKPSAALNTTRQKAKQVLRDAPQTASSIESARTLFNTMTEPLKARYYWVGYIDDASGEASLKLREGQSLQDGASLWAVQDGALVQCGDVDADEAKFNRSRDWLSKRWTPVYMKLEE